MRLGYNTNGFAHHRLEDAITILGEIGYRSVAITIDQGALDPTGANPGGEIDRIASLLECNEMGCVIETGARFLLDPRRKHHPTLLDADQDGRVQRELFLRYAIQAASALRADAVSLWSGPKGAEFTDNAAMALLVESCRRLCRLGEAMETRLAFEPEPGMFIDTMQKFAELHERVKHPLFGLTLDIGHVHCLGDGVITAHLKDWRERLFNVHLEDMRYGTHEHLRFGDGEIDIDSVLRCLVEIDYGFGAHVELSRHSHDAVNTARASFDRLSGAAARTASRRPN